MPLFSTAVTAYRRTRSARAARRDWHTLRETILAAEDTELRTWTPEQLEAAHAQLTQAARAARIRWRPATHEGRTHLPRAPLWPGS